LASYDRAIVHQPADAETHCNRGVILEDLGRWQDALASHGRALDLRPDYTMALWNQDLCWLALGRYDLGW